MTGTETRLKDEIARLRSEKMNGELLPVSERTRRGNKEGRSTGQEQPHAASLSAVDGCQISLGDLLMRRLLVRIFFFLCEHHVDRHGSLDGPTWQRVELLAAALQLLVVVVYADEEAADQRAEPNRRVPLACTQTDMETHEHTASSATNS